MEHDREPEGGLTLENAIEACADEAAKKETARSLRGEKSVVTKRILRVGRGWEISRTPAPRRDAAFRNFVEKMARGDTGLTAWANPYPTPPGSGRVQIDRSVWQDARRATARERAELVLTGQSYTNLRFYRADHLIAANRARNASKAAPVQRVGMAVQALIECQPDLWDAAVNGTYGAQIPCRRWLRTNRPELQDIDDDYLTKLFGNEVRAIKNAGARPIKTK